MATEAQYGGGGVNIDGRYRPTYCGGGKGFGRRLSPAKPTPVYVGRVNKIAERKGAG